MAEVAYYRFVFLDGTAAASDHITVDLTAFAVSTRTATGVDLVAAPFSAHRRAIASRARYDTTQALGAAMRADGVALCRYPSARDPLGGVNVAVFTPTAFGRSAPHGFQSWRCRSDRSAVELTRRDLAARETYVFERGAFLVKGRLPMPAMG